MNGTHPRVKTSFGRSMYLMSDRFVRVRRSAVLAAVSALVLLGSPGIAGAAELVDVRIGTHPTFTRVVFELDGPGGYSVERQLAEDGTPQLLVMMDAGSSPRSLDSKSLMVERVAVQDGIDRSLAHVRLKRKPSRLKEMILSNPPRLVFDFIYPEEVIAARKAAEKPAAKPAPSKPAPKPAPVARTEPPAPKPAPVAKAQPAPKPAPAPVAKAKPAPKPAPAPVAKAQPAPKPAPKPAPAVAPAPKPEPIAKAAPLAKPETAPRARVEKKDGGTIAKAEAAAKEEMDAAEAKLANTRDLVNQKLAASAADAKATADDMEDAAAMAAKNLAAAQAEPAPVKPAPVTKPLAQVPPAPSSSTPSSGGGVDWMLVAGAGAGVLALFIGFVLWNRRRSLPNDIDVTALADEAGDDAAPQAEVQDDEFAIGGHEQTAPPSAADSMFEDSASQVGQSEPEAAPQQTEIAAGPGLFDDDDSEKENDAMDLDGPDLPMERTASEMPTQMNVAPPAAAAAGDGDVARLLREMESRLVKLETRLDEANDARERLERQVTAQAEELRVQRAAIARTQRALRGMNSGEEDQATEPAIRQPSS